jgi:phosphopantetheinyl transferase
LPLQLGVPLIHLGVPPLHLSLPDGQVEAHAFSQPSSLGEFGRTVATREAGQRALAGAIAGPAALPVAAAPTSRRVPLAVPFEPLTATEPLLLSCETFPELADHCLFPQPEGWPVVADRAPSVPLTMSLAFLVDAAERLMPGKVAVAVENVVASAWMLVEPPLRVDVTAERVAQDRVHVRVATNIEGDVLMADRYPERPLPGLPPIRNPATPALRQEAIYRDRWMFHGPSYFGLTGLDVMGDNGIRGEVTALPARGALLDAAGQLASIWILLHTQSDRLSMPVKVGRLELYGPELRNREKLTCNVEIKYFGQREVRSDIELVLDGRVYFRITDWEDWRFHTGGGVFAVMQFPERNLLSETYPGGWTLIRDSDRPLSAMEFLAGRFLTAVEIAEVKQLQGRRRQGDWLYGRIAAKDAVRSLLFERGYGAIYPVEIVISSDAQGRPSVSGPFSEDVRVSIAHSDKIAVALATEGTDPGIDVERVEPRTEAFAALSFSAEELSLLPGVDRDEWLTRFWCAKEAVGKARGTGLAGSPRTLRIMSLEGERLLVEDKWVESMLIGDYVVAWTK